MSLSSKYNLGFISDSDILSHVVNTVKNYRTSIDLKKFNQNIIDPIKLTFDAKVYNKDIETVVADECFRQIDKSNSNIIGYFHQNIFKYAGDEWQVPTKGYDLINSERHIYAEIKNKHNTMNSSSSQKTYMKMQNTILQDDEATCYLVEVISALPGDRAWQISLNGTPISHKNIRKISVDAFYGIVFNDPHAFYKLCTKLPEIIGDAVAITQSISLHNSVFDELSELDPNIQKSLFLLAFSQYEGFSNVSKDR